MTAWGRAVRWLGRACALVGLVAALILVVGFTVALAVGVFRATLGLFQ